MKMNWGSLITVTLLAILPNVARSEKISISAEVSQCMREQAHARTHTILGDPGPQDPDFSSVVTKISSQGTRTLITTDGQERILRDTVIVVIDENNLNRLSEKKTDEKILSLCSLLLGNGANVVMIDLTNESPANKVLAKKEIGTS